MCERERKGVDREGVGKERGKRRRRRERERERWNEIKRVRE